MPILNMNNQSQKPQHVSGAEAAIPDSDAATPATTTDQNLQQLLAALVQQQQQQQLPQYQPLQLQHYVLPNSSPLDQLLAQLTQENLRLKLQLQQVQSQPPPRERVLVLLPSTVSVDNLSLTEVAAEASKFLGRPASLVDVSVTVAQSPLVTIPQQAAAQHAHRSRSSTPSSTETAPQLRSTPAVSAAQSTRHAVTRSPQSRSTSAASTWLAFHQEQAKIMQSDAKVTCSSATDMVIGGAAACELIDDIHAETVASAHGDISEHQALDAGIVQTEDDQATTTISATGGSESERDVQANHHQHRPHTPELMEQPALQGTGCDASRASAATSAPSARIPASHSPSIVTEERPTGTGPAPYHVTIRGLRPSTSANQLLALARDYSSLKQLFFPPHKPRRYVGRAAVYFFASREDAGKFEFELRRRRLTDEFRNEFALTEEDKQRARDNGVWGEAEGRAFSLRQVDLSIRMADMMASCRGMGSIERQPPVPTSTRNGCVAHEASTNRDGGEEQ